MAPTAPLATVYTEGKRIFDLQAQYIADLHPVPNLHHAAVLRSPHAHAWIRHIDVAAATALPGVVGVLTGQDVAEWCRPFAVAAERPGRYYPCAIDKVRYVGEPVAVIVATDRYVARMPETWLKSITSLCRRLSTLRWRWKPRPLCYTTNKIRTWPLTAPLLMAMSMARLRLPMWCSMGAIRSAVTRHFRWRPTASSRPGIRPNRKSQSGPTFTVLTACSLFFPAPCRCP